MKDLKDRLHDLLYNPLPYGVGLPYEVRELASILGDLLDRLDTKPECEHLNRRRFSTNVICQDCGAIVGKDFSKG